MITRLPKNFKVDLTLGAHTPLLSTSSLGKASAALQREPGNHYSAIEGLVESALSVVARRRCATGSKMRWAGGCWGGGLSTLNSSGRRPLEIP